MLNSLSVLTGLRGLALAALLAGALVVLAACSGDDEQQQQQQQAAEPSQQQAEQQSSTAASGRSADDQQAQAQAQDEPSATSQQQAQQEQQQQVAAAPSGDKEEIIFSDLNWTSSEIQVRAAAFIVEHGYGYPVELQAGDTTSLFQGLIQGDTHITMEIWPAQQPWIDDLDDPGVIDILGDSLDENWEGWVIPQYVKDANPGLVSVSDLPDYIDLFVTADSRGRARFVGCVPGWACEQVNSNKIVAYGLEDLFEVIAPGSGAALFEDLESTYARGEAWLGYMWGPTKPTATLDLYRLEEPEWTEDCWNSHQGCAYPSSEVRIAVHRSLSARAPEIIEFLRAWDFSADVQVQSEIWMSDNNASPDEAAIWYLENNPRVWAAFVPDEVAARVLDALGLSATALDRPTIVFSDLNWTSSEIQVRAAAFITEHGYGYPVELQAGDTVSLFQGLINGDTHVTMEIWPAQQPWIDELEDPDIIALLGDSLDENWEGWVIPQYVKDANPGLVSVSDLPDYMELFVTADSRGRARFIDCVPGWACEQVNGNKVVAYGLEDVLELVKPGSGAALFEDLESTYARGEAWLGYMWGPTKPTATLDLYRLEEPEWTEECWNSDQGCAYPASEVRIAVYHTMLNDAPDIVEFLLAWDFAADVQVLSEIWMSDNNASPDEAAIWYLKSYPEVWSAYVTADAAAAVLAALAEED
ncbi:MAG: hypothetical protein F4038_00230 [Chloroflexi bacterium]|nr:hypothetical protein [Chloroflexota bacterium]MYJ91466.1 hypothetical protein [Chloroflexota bacterium]